MMTKILELDTVSVATAAAHDAAARVAGVAEECFEKNFWFNGGGVIEVDLAEQSVQQLGAYVASRRDQPSGEQLFLKAKELKLNQLADWTLQPWWLKAAYRVFAMAGWALAKELENVQQRARDEEELARLALPVAQADVDTMLKGVEQMTGALKEFNSDIKTELPSTVAPVAGDEAGAGVPPDAAAPVGAVAEGEALPSATLGEVLNEAVESGVATAERVNGGVEVTMPIAAFVGIAEQQSAQKKKQR